MNDSTKNKFAAILAAAQAKEAAKAKPLSNATGDKKPAPKAIAAAAPTAKPQPKPTPPAPVFKPQVKDIFPTISTTTQNSPELSTVTFDDIMNVSSEKETPTTPPATPAAKQPTPGTGDIELIEYSPLSFVVRGEGTRQIKDTLMEKGGAFNRFLKCGPGFVFSKKKYFTVKTLLESLQVK